MSLTVVSTGHGHLLVTHDGVVTQLRSHTPHESHEPHKSHEPHTRNALNDGLIAAIHASPISLPSITREAFISGEGGHSCAGRDLGKVGKS